MLHGIVLNEGEGIFNTHRPTMKGITVQAAWTTYSRIMPKKDILEGKWNTRCYGSVDSIGTCLFLYDVSQPLLWAVV